MGMDQATVGVLQQGIGLVGDFMNLANSGTENGSSAYANEANEQGRMVEIDARGNALNAQSQAKKDASTVRSTQEGLRAKRSAEWGRSNLAMSGSKQLVEESNRTKDLQAEDDTLFQGQTEADEIMNEGRHKANMLRINGGSTPVRSTLSLGSIIYGPKGY